MSDFETHPVGTTKRLEEVEAKLERATDLLDAIHDKAHELSTGPAVPDGYWEIRQMAAAPLVDPPKVDSLRPNATQPSEDRMG